MNGTILAIFPHPDDEAFGAAGTLAMHVQGGAHAAYACLTLGEMGRNMGFPPFASRVTLPGIRRQELASSCEAIGIQDLRMLGFHDKTIEFEPEERLDSAIHALVEELRPALVITFYPGYSVHPDHDATGAAVIRVIGRLEPGSRPDVHCIAFAGNAEHDLGQPDIVVQVKPFLPQKLASIQAHRSQFQAAELLGTKSLTDEEIEQRYGVERFWTYRFPS